MEVSNESKALVEKKNLIMQCKKTVKRGMKDKATKLQTPRQIAGSDDNAFGCFLLRYVAEGF